MASLFFFSQARSAKLRRFPFNQRALASVCAALISAAASTGCMVGADDDSMPGAGGSGGGGGASHLVTTNSGGAGGNGAGGNGTGSGGNCVLDDFYVSEVVAVDYGPGQNFGQTAMPEVVYGPPRGGGCCSGSTDVVSLGNGGTITLGFSGRRIIDGPGVDFVVFENPFEGPMSVFAELAQVEVSEDGEQWFAFPCSTLDPPYDSCAGVAPVYLVDDEGPIDVATAGGDGFDLADIGVPSARFVRITDREDQQGFSGVFDLDAVGIVNGSCR